MAKIRFKKGGYIIFLLLCFSSYLYTQTQSGSGVWSAIRNIAGTLTIRDGDIIMSDNRHIVGDDVFSHFFFYAADSVETTITAAGTYYQLANAFTAGSATSSDFTFQTDSLIYTGTDTIEAEINIQIGASSGNANTLGSWQLFRNFVGLGQEAIQSRHFGVADRTGALGFVTMIYIAPNDTLQLRATGYTNGMTLAHDHIQFSLKEVERIR